MKRPARILVFIQILLICSTVVVFPFYSHAAWIGWYALVVFSPLLAVGMAALVYCLFLVAYWAWTGK